MDGIIMILLQGLEKRTSDLINENNLLRQQVAELNELKAMMQKQQNASIDAIAVQQD